MGYCLFWDANTLQNAVLDTARLYPRGKAGQYWSDKHHSNTNKADATRCLVARLKPDGKDTTVPPAGEVEQFVRESEVKKACQHAHDGTET